MKNPQIMENYYWTFNTSINVPIWNSKMLKGDIYLVCEDCIIGPS